MTATPVSTAGTERRELEYVYQDGDGFVLFDPAVEEFVTVPEACAPLLARYVKEGERISVLFHDGQPLVLEPPARVHLRVADTDAPVPGAMASKVALLETGVRVRVPAFIVAGDTVAVDPRNGTYLGRPTAP